MEGNISWFTMYPPKDHKENKYLYYSQKTEVMRDEEKSANVMIMENAEKLLTTISKAKDTNKKILQ
jgi:hypothetical protein